MKKKENEIKQQEVKTQKKNCYLKPKKNIIRCPACGIQASVDDFHCGYCGCCLYCD